MKRERRAFLKDQTRHFAAGVLESTSPTASTRFEHLDLTDEEQLLVEEELRAIIWRIFPATNAKGNADE